MSGGLAVEMLINEMKGLRWCLGITRKIWDKMAAPESRVQSSSRQTGQFEISPERITYIVVSCSASCLAKRVRLIDPWTLKNAAYYYGTMVLYTA